MLGTLHGTDAYFRQAWVEASTHYGIGGSLDGNDDGVIYQWVDIGSDRIPWASGPWRAPGYGDGQAFVEKWGVYGINAYTESIEFSGQMDTPMTVNQWQMGIWLTAYILHAAGRDAESIWWNMHHREFCTPRYKDCPFPRIYLHTADYQDGIYQTMQHYEGKRVAETVNIAGLVVPLPLHQSPAKPGPEPTKPLFVPFPKPRRGELWNATGRQWGNTQAPVLMTFRDGERDWFAGYYHGQTVAGDDRWYVRDHDPRVRVHSSGIKRWLADEPEDTEHFTNAREQRLFRAAPKNADSAGTHWL